MERGREGMVEIDFVTFRTGHHFGYRFAWIGFTPQAHTEFEVVGYKCGMRQA